MTQPNTDRLDFISSLRAFAALSVAVVHVRYAMIPAATVPAWLEPIVGFGGHGVTLFFIISAFTLCLSGDRRQEEALPLTSFYMRRFFRIAPLFYAWLLFSLARNAYFFDQTYSWQKILMSLTFSFNLWPSEQSGIVWASWTIGVEMLFYLMFPFIYARTRTVFSAVVAVAITIAANVLLSHVGGQPSVQRELGMSIVVMLPVFLMGVLAYRIYERLKHTLRPVALGRWLVAMGVAGIAYCVYDRAKTGGSLYLPAAFFAITVLGLGLLALRLRMRAIVNPTTIFLGEISYSIYLAHTTACNLVQHLVEPVYAALPRVPAFIVLYVLVVALAVAASYVTYKLIERPGEDMGRRIIRRLRSRATVSPGAATA